VFGWRPHQQFNKIHLGLWAVESIIITCSGWYQVVRSAVLAAQLRYSIFAPALYGLLGTIRQPPGNRMSFNYIISRTVSLEATPSFFISRKLPHACSTLS
jgi:hypothetical protein